MISHLFLKRPLFKTTELELGRRSKRAKYVSIYKESKVSFKSPSHIHLEKFRFTDSNHQKF